MPHEYSGRGGGRVKYAYDLFHSCFITGGLYKIKHFIIKISSRHVFSTKRDLI